MAQSFSSFGSQVTQIEKPPNILSREDTDAALIVQTAMEHDGVNFVLYARTVRIQQRGDETSFSSNRMDENVKFSATSGYTWIEPYLNSLMQKKDMN